MVFIFISFFVLIATFLIWLGFVNNPTVRKVQNDRGSYEWRKVQIGGIDQYIHIRTQDVSKPVMLFLHGGPGTSETPFLAKYNKNLEGEFVLVSWDQRGAGKSYSKKIPGESFTIDQFISDTVELTKYLKKEFKREKIYLVGHSWGTLLGIKAAHINADDYYALISIAQTSDGAKEELITYETVLEQAIKSGNQKAIAELTNIGPPVNGKYKDDNKSLGLKLKWVRFFGGAAFHNEKSIWPLIKDVITTDVYSIKEKLTYPMGESLALKYLYDDVRSIKLSDEINVISVPMYFFHGQYDNQVPISVAKDFFDSVDTPKKKFYVFEDAAHGVIFEDPQRFFQIIKDEILPETL